VSGVPDFDRATHKQLLASVRAIAGINVTRVSDGQIRENWTVIDMLGMFQQLGRVSAPGATAG
jgi:hypothetical protein